MTQHFHFIIGNEITVKLQITQSGKCYHKLFINGFYRRVPLIYLTTFPVHKAIQSQPLACLIDHLHFANREVKQSAPCDRTWEDWNSRTGILEAWFQSGGGRGWLSEQTEPGLRSSQPWLGARNCHRLAAGPWPSSDLGYPTCARKGLSPAILNS